MFCDTIFDIYADRTELDAKGDLCVMRTSFIETIKIILAFLLSLFFMACTPQALHYQKEPLKERGEVLIYIQPMPKEADTFRFTIENISVITDAGADIALPVSLTILKGADLVGVQKLLASGIIPHGTYKGIRVKIRSAHVQGKQGEAKLLVSEDSLMVKHAFEVRRGEISTLFFSFDPLKSLTDGILFTPLFTLTTYVSELLSLTGYITDTESNMISVFNKKTMLMLGAIATGRAPMGIVFDQARGLAYAALSGDDFIEVVDVFAGKFTGRIRLNFGDEPHYLSLAPDGNTLLSVNHGSNTVSIIETKTRAEVRRLNVGVQPTSVVIDPQGLRAYIMNSLSNSISVLDISRKTIYATISVEGIPLRGAFNRKGDKLYVINMHIPYLTVIDPSRLTGTEKIFIGTGAVSIKADTRNGLIYVGNRTGGEITVINPSSSIFVDTIRTGGTAVFMTIDDQENTLFALIPERKILQKINLTNKRIMAEIDVGEGAYALAVMGER
jgi:YVTN family beta-propeller protein